MSRFEPWSEERAAEIVAEHAGLEGPLMPVLHAVQETFGHVPEDAVPFLARAYNLSRAEVHGVVTFYHDFRHELPGKHILKLCRAEACQSMGCEALVERAESKLGIECGNTTADGRVTFEAIYCLGLCATAPSAMIDGKIVGRLTPGKLDTILKEAQS
jgi:formate dehydrogenase subunit gamma